MMPAGRLARLRLLLGSSSARLVMFAFAVQLLLVGAALGIVYARSLTAFAVTERSLIMAVRSDLVATWQVGGQAALVRLIDQRLTDIGEDANVILVDDGHGKALAGNLDGWPPGVGDRPGWQRARFWRPGLGPTDHELNITRLPGGKRLLVGRSLSEQVALARTVGTTLVWAMLAAVPLALAMAIALGRVVARRLRTVAQTAAAVAGGDLSRRAVRDGSHDAVDDLAMGINAMLDRIEALVGELRMITDGLAHDLKSPLTRLKSRLEEAREEAQDPGAQAALDDVAEEADRLLAMLGTALQISRAEAGIGRDHFAETDIDALLEDSVELYGPLAESREVALDHAPGAAGSARVHRQLLQQALANLIDNALNHAEGATRISVGARREGEWLAISVADNGCGIPANRRDEAMRRFARLDSARHIAGSGLGLSLVEAVARLHGGRLQLGDADPGLLATLWLPPEPPA